MFLSFKVMVLVLSFKCMQDGTWKRPMGVGVTLAILLPLLMFFAPGFNAVHLQVQIVAGLILCPLVLLLVWMNEGVFLYLFLCSLGSIALLFLWPMLSYECAEWLLSV